MSPIRNTTPKAKISKAQKKRPCLDTVITELTALHSGLLGSPQTPVMVGVDEAGRGCLAGPVVAGAVILPSPLTPHAVMTATESSHSLEVRSTIDKALSLPPHIAESLTGLADSKKMTEHQRETLAPLIRQHALAWGLGVVWPSTIDKVNILQATFLAMARAVYNLRMQATYLLIDGNKKIPAHAFAASRAFQRGTHDMASLQQHTIIGGDDLIPAISAASILAKTYRDALMVSFDKRYPAYGFARHKGYGTKDHLNALVQHGPCAQHRLTFRGVMPEKDRANEPVSLSLW